MIVNKATVKELGSSEFHAPSWLVFGNRGCRMISLKVAFPMLLSYENATWSQMFLPSLPTATAY